jgi:hypothetical protein
MTTNRDERLAAFAATMSAIERGGSHSAAERVAFLTAIVKAADEGEPFPPLAPSSPALARTARAATRLQRIVLNTHKDELTRRARDDFKINRLRWTAELGLRVGLEAAEAFAAEIEATAEARAA